MLYSHNVRDPIQVHHFSSQLQTMSKNSTELPLFIAVDQEGGSVARIRKNTQVLPAAMAIGATHSSQLSFLAGKMTATDLAAMGINMNLAPVLDVNTNEENSVIGIRSFGEDPELVSQLGMWYIEGLQSQGVVATAKHFPGHGGTALDSHFTIPVINKNLDDLEKFNLIPFRRAMENGLDAVMTAHISVPSLDPSGLPATFSYNLLTNIMRKKMNFDGIVITDDLEMKSIQNQCSSGQAALKAVLAGADMVMIGWSDQKKKEVFNTLLNAVTTGKLSEERLNVSVKRILKLKLKRGLFNAHREPSSDTWVQRAPSSAVAQNIANHAVTVVSNESSTLPFREDDGRRVLLITSVPQFYQALKFTYGKVTPYYISSRPTITEVEKTVSALIAK
ncbi:MAG: beta-N-acetylhexosaminidase, partial [Nanoarchaeota archaeon]|nr:beta-N-acetylhexosaminidase [Nanoarchaeota archaeon]